MAEAWMGECLTVLRLMKGDPWEDGHRALYQPVLRDLGEVAAKRVVGLAADTLRWRPSRAELRELADRLKNPRQVDAEQCYAEIRAAIQDYPFGAQDPNNPNVLLSGEPEWSSPVVAEVVRLLGGYGVLGEWITIERGNLRKALTPCYESAQRRYRDGTLCLPRGENVKEISA